MEIFHAIPSERMNAVPSIGIRLYRGDRSGEFIEVDLMNAKYMDLESLEHVPEIRNHKEAQKLIADLIYLKPDLEIRGEIPESIQKRVQMLEAKEKQEVQMKAITEKLEQGMKDVFQSDQYQNFLNTMAKFPRYSVNNSLLIMMQKPEAKLCQSFTGWKEMGRFVKKGEKGIKILAPAPYTIHREQNKLDENGNKIIDLDGKPIMENVEVKINAFKVVNTFDVSQTEGKELPNIGVEELMGSVKDYTDMFEAIKESIPVPITFEQIESGAKGYFQRSENRIALQEGMSEIQTIKTLLHEAAHQKLHSMENSKKGEMPKTRLQKEVEAESVAYVVCQHYGIDTSDYSFGYVAGWSGGKELPELKAALQTIRRAASELISSIDEKWKGLVTAKETERKPEEQSRKSAAKKPSVKKTISEKKEKAARTPKEKKEKINGELASVL